MKLGFRWGTCLSSIVILSALISNPAEAKKKSRIEPLLNPTQRDSLRYRLENLYNEVDLLIRNQKVDRADVKRQEMEIAQLKLYERIPFEKKVEELKRSLQRSAYSNHLRWVLFRSLPYAHSYPSVPKLVFTDTSFQLTQDQLVERIPFRVTVLGTEQTVKKWIESWKNLTRLVELDLQSTPNSLIQKGKNLWEVQGFAYRFRDIQFPLLKPRSPRELLPEWAKLNLPVFIQTEPLLWSFVTRFEKLAPRATPLYKIRGQFHLNEARLNFFWKKVKHHH